MKMLKFRQAALALAAAGLLSGQVYAGEAQVQDLPVAQVETIVAQPLAVFTEADVNAMFEQDAQPMQLAVLSSQEMRETEGAVIPLMILGTAAAGAWGHHANSWLRTGRIGTSRGAAWAAGSSAIGVLHGRVLVTAGALRGGQAMFMRANGAAVGGSLGFVNPF